MATRPDSGTPWAFATLSVNEFVQVKSVLTTVRMRPGRTFTKVYIRSDAAVLINVPSRPNIHVVIGRIYNLSSFRLPKPNDIIAVAYTKTGRIFWPEYESPVNIIPVDRPLRVAIKMYYAALSKDPTVNTAFTITFSLDKDSNLVAVATFDNGFPPRTRSLNPTAWLAFREQH